MWFIGFEVEQETSAPPPKKIQDPPLQGTLVMVLRVSPGQRFHCITEELLVYEFFAGYLLNRLLQQLPKPDMIKTVNSWAKLIFPQLVSTAPKVRTVTLGILWVRCFFILHFMTQRGTNYVSISLKSVSNKMLIFNNLAISCALI